MIDIHCHLLYHVDDGAKTIEESVAMLDIAQKQGIEGMILTPHYRHGMFDYPRDRIEEHYNRLKPLARERGIQLFLGCEYHVNSGIVKAFDGGRCHTLADTRYVLTEYSHQSELSYIRSMTQELLFHGYIPVIAHIERYACMLQSLEAAGELQNMGALIQTNAAAVLGLESWGIKRYCKKLLKEGYVDIIASDSHNTDKRACHMLKCYEYIAKKFDKAYAQELMHDNPKKIIDSQGDRNGKSV